MKIFVDPPNMEWCPGCLRNNDQQEQMFKQMPLCASWSVFTYYIVHSKAAQTTESQQL